MRSKNEIGSDRERERERDTASMTTAQTETVMRNTT